MNDTLALCSVKNQTSEPSSSHSYVLESFSQWFCIVVKCMPNTGMDQIFHWLFYNRIEHYYSVLLIVD